MRDAEPRAIYLRDYQVPDFLIDKTHLHFALHPQTTRVTSELKIRRNPEAEQSDRELVLHGQEIDLQSVSINGKQLNASEYRVDSESLTVFNVPESFTFSTVGFISPEQNTSLEGLYKSKTMYCTQCEAEGFRKITYYLDRPDVLSEFTTTVVANKAEYPVLLSNGNPVKFGDLDDDTHFVTWHDPFRKPAYLFALVAGDLAVLEDSFTTMSGREVTLKIFVEDKDIDKCDHAMTSLKNSMRWDEEVYGREYDLDIFMIVAVDDFNMGAMENKGLNIFNTSCVLAKPETTTDFGFQRVESVVAHEYFHNWSGNRVTCRDWFQLSLKEGFTVFRDSEFSADMGSRTVKRVEEVKLLRTMQFAEDAGPMAHPVQPASFIEISNFYTLTVYEKGAEVVRMLHTLLGPEQFRKGSDIYFARHDGGAATINDFVAAMEEASGRDLKNFMSWYSQAGTPVLKVSDQFDSVAQTYTLTFHQSCPSTPEASESEKSPYVIPMAMGLVTSAGPIALQFDAAGGHFDASRPTHAVLELTKSEESITFSGVSERPVPSLLRNFSSPVRLQFNYDRDQLVTLITKDDDGFNRWDASQQLAVAVIHDAQSQLSVGAGIDIDARLLTAFGALLQDRYIDAAMVAHMLSLPSEVFLAEIAEVAAVDDIHKARSLVKKTIAKSLIAELSDRFASLPSAVHYSATAEQIAVRSLKNICLEYLVATGESEWLQAAFSQFTEANNMTDQMAALTCLVHSDAAAAEPMAAAALAAFYQRWQAEALVVNQWFSVQATAPQPNTLAKVRTLMEHEAFTLKNPNKVRGLIGAFANNNPVNFHQADGQGYGLLSEVVIALNTSNPQMAARMLAPLTRWKKYDANRQGLMRAELQKIGKVESLSKDVFEVISKSLDF
ncbi:aminopeptidase N [Halioxenophilus sp. WMMB6]|uniref:aminopeptidase N n=1 Tax=Halioxenophilus sp. WMMB6 TaxID=3073815 RepID=UPI00295EF261|nr:aminopeptidase N [Halioxenophilus sp. WMMB6]